MYAVKLSTVPRRRTASRYSGNVSKSQAMPAASVAGIHVLDVLERAHDQVVVLGPGRRDREAAVAGHDRGDAVVRRRPQRGVPEHLRVVVGVDVDEPRRDRAARGVELALAAQVRSDLADHAVRDRHVGRLARRAGAVEDRSAADDEVSRSDVPFTEALTDGVREVLEPRHGRTGGRPAVDRQHDPGDLRRASLARNRTAFATSAGEPMRWSGCMRRTISVWSYDVLMLVGDVRRCDAVHPDAVLGEVDRDRTGVNWMTAAFDAAIGHQPAAGVDPADRRGVDDRATAVLGHVAGRSLAADHDAVDVHAHQRVEVAQVVVEEAARASPRSRRCCT